MKIFYSFFCFFLFFVSSVGAGEIVDLTHSFSQNTIYWPTEKGFELEKIGWTKTPQGYFYAANLFKAPEHGGTHIDAPVHFTQGGRSVDEIPPSQLVGQAAVIDVRPACAKDRDYEISKKDVQSWEKNHGPLGAEDIVLFYTGWDKYWGDKKKYLGTDKFADVKNLHFPGISSEAANYLKNKNIKGVGLDTPSLDHGPSHSFMSHRILLNANIYGIENVTCLDKLPARGVNLYVAPMKIEQGTGAPVRIFAVLPAS